MHVLQETIRNLQTQLLANRVKEQEDTRKIVTLEERLKKANVKELLMKTKIAEASRVSKDTSSGKESEADESEVDSDSDNEDVQIIETKSPDVVIGSDDDEDEVGCEPKKNELEGTDVEMAPKSVDQISADCLNANEAIQLTEFKARIISLATAFLMIHPTGALFENIFTYVKQSIVNLSKDELRSTLQLYSAIFSLELSASNYNNQLGDDDGSLTAKEMWKFVGFANTNLISDDENDNKIENNNSCDDPKEVLVPLELKTLS